MTTVIYNFGLLFFFPLILIAILSFVFWIIMLIDAATRKFKGESDKVVWVLVIVLVGIVGALIYYFVVYMKDRQKSIRWFWWTLLGLVLLFLLILLIMVYSVGGTDIVLPGNFIFGLL